MSFSRIPQVIKYVNFLEFPSKQVKHCVKQVKLDGRYLFEECKPVEAGEEDDGEESVG